jgi:hypothetical protein
MSDLSESERSVWSPEEKEIHAVMDEVIDALSIEDDDDEDPDDDGGTIDDTVWNSPYERSITIPLPKEVEQAFGDCALTLPMADILEIYAAKCDPAQAIKINGIRDGYYSGDRSEDYYRSTGSRAISRVTAEDRARGRIALKKSAAERESRKVELQAEMEAERALEQEMKALLADEFAAYESNAEAYNARCEALDLEWERFVVASDAAATPWPESITKLQAALWDRVAQLGREGDALDDREADLWERANAAYESRRSV